MKLKLFLFISWVGFCLSSSVWGSTTNVSKIGAELRGVKSSSSLSLLFGSRYLHYLSNIFAVGGAAYTGQISEGATGSISYGGLMAAVSKVFSQSLSTEMTLLIGGGGGFVANGAVGGGIALEPNLSLGFKLGDSSRASLGVGYVWIPNNRQFSGYTVGIRFDFLNGLENQNRTPASDEF